ETLIACFNRMKVEEAERLLRETELSVAQVAQELGFSDSKYFNTIFKKQTGITPAVYRKEQRKG
ncbi:MAG: helix-turn-helix transcriptional regulator, partial [Clostridia bacterium]|nr:helix-turn-helix transcriptional regulator [Clostridia bacterium]